ncbi:MAG: 23S rRNA (pseudouridine(1915)-N(3))-methyltransferase RlmH [Gammaproteobacteria bacterium]|nr:23S rRNA (pseudouridine(1915)-N(3))-methyltransferase RlmH [Gammaproteobacteria bacterium]
MRFTISAVGKRSPNWVQEGFAAYQKRFATPFSLQLNEIEAGKRLTDIAKITKEEGDKILASVPKGGRLIALDERGKLLSTLQLAEQIKDWQIDGRDCVFAIGGADGHDPRVLQAADLKWSLSPLTFPHAMVRVLLAEQLYRAVSVINGHPYHRE